MIYFCLYGNYSSAMTQSSDADIIVRVKIFFFFCPVLCSNDDVAWQDLGCGYEHLLV